MAGGGEVAEAEAAAEAEAEVAEVEEEGEGGGSEAGTAVLRESLGFLRVLGVPSGCSAPVSISQVMAAWAAEARESFLVGKGVLRLPKGWVGREGMTTSLAKRVPTAKVV